MFQSLFFLHNFFQNFVCLFVCFFVCTHFCSEEGNLCAIWCAGAARKFQVVFMYENNDNDVLFVCLLVNLFRCLHKCMNVSMCSLWSCLTLEIPKGCKYYCCHPLQFHKIYGSPINRAVCQLSSIPGATAQLIACTWATKVFSQS